MPDHQTPFIKETAATSSTLPLHKFSHTYAHDTSTVLSCGKGFTNASQKTVSTQSEDIPPFVKNINIEIQL